jgi:hypothetical protein
MDKPTKKSVGEAVYHYHDVIDYIEHKYNIQTRGYKRELDGIYRDFWHWFIEHAGGNVRNGSFAHFGVEDFRDENGNFIVSEADGDSYFDCPWWVVEILEMLEKEFPGITHEKVWVEW